MIKNFFSIFKDDRKYFAIVFFILFLILLSGFLTPFIVKHQQENWDKELSEKIHSIETSVTAEYKEKEKSLLLLKNNIKRRLRETLKPGNTSYGRLVRTINSDEYDGYSIEVFAPNGRLIAWSKDIAIQQDDIFPLSFPAGEAYFYNTELITYLSVIDTLYLESDQFYFAVSKPFEKNYTLQNSYYNEINFSKELSNKYLSEFEITYLPYSQKTKDGRKYSFDLLNNNKNKIGTITFIKPALTNTINSIYDFSSRFQSILVFFGLIFLGFGLRKDFKLIRYRSLRLLLFILYCSGFRLLIYLVGFPTKMLEGALVDPSYFSSAFAGGIVKSPVEFFITNLFFIVISIYFFQVLKDFINRYNQGRKRSLIVKIIISFFLIFLFLIIIRGFSAAIRSVIFDSTLRYFKEPDLLPDIPLLIMDLNVLLIGFGTILFLTGLILLLFSLHNLYLQKKKQRIIYIFLILEILGIIFILLQREPLLTILLNSSLILAVFLLAYYIFYIKLNSVFNYIFAAFAASIISISLLNYFNQQLERESLKTAAIEINRPNENLLKFMIRETLEGTLENQKIINSFYKKNTDFNAIAFLVWTSSAFQRESINSSVAILDENKNVLGKFSVGVNDEINYAGLFQESDYNELIIIETRTSEINSNNYAGILPLNLNGNNSFFISAVVSIDYENPSGGNLPEFLESKKNILNSVVDINQLKIFELKDGRVSRAYGDIYPSRDQIRPIINFDFPPENEAWLNLTLNEEPYITYLLRTSTEEGTAKITAVSLRENEISWNLFNFFKLFIIHSLFIFSFYIILFLINLKQFRYSFRIQLLTALLLVSILPVLFLAIYNRQVVSEKSSIAIFDELNERSEYLMGHIAYQLLKHGDRDINVAFENAGRELGISFGIYDATNLVYNSKAQYYEAGLFPTKLNPRSHYFLNYLSYREFINKEKIEDFEYSSFYKKIKLDEKDLIIGVNDAFNKIKLPYTTIDVDVFLFGVYAFVVIIIIIFSTILANRISEPIRRLTQATESVAHGDLNVELVNNERGELKDLLEGFNSMTRELQRNQSELAEMEREIAWKEMAKQVAHEIKNPLTPMKLAVQQLIISYKDKSQNFDTIFEKVSSTILNQIENLSSIASEFSRFARMPRFKLEDVDVINVLNDTIHLFVNENITIKNESELQSAPVEADMNQMRRMLINMIRNSIQADSSEIRFKIYPENDHFIFHVSDNGKGIPEAYREKIFDTDFTTKEKGMGLGLKLAKRFIEGIKGSINLVESNDKGTTFEIILPKSISAKIS